MLEREFQAAINTFGKEQQMVVAIEELSELQKELSKDLRGLGNRDNLVEELTDVIIMIDQLRHIFRISDSEVKRLREYKAKRLAKKMRLKEW